MTWLAWRSGSGRRGVSLAANVERDDEVSRVEAWRLQCLLDANWKPFRAQLLAARLDVDVHDAVDLLRRGCDQKTALKILL